MWKPAAVMCSTMVSSVCTSAAVAGDPALAVELVTDGLTDPVFITHAPGDTTRLFVLEQYVGTTGRIRIIDLTTNTLLATPFLEVPDVTTWSEGGLLGLVFHPDFETNGFFYVNYTTTAAGPDRTVIERYHVPPETPNVADADTGLVILEYGQPSTNHNAGWLGFGPNDGYLYIPTGDGGGACDPNQRAQDNTDNLLGKVLRIDVDNPDTGLEYGIPDDNPFVGVTGDDEIWAYGLRNPYRCSFDRETGDLWIGDVGQQAWEEVNFQPAGSDGGENYGWDCREGDECANDASFLCAGSTNGCSCGAGGFVDPIHQYSHAEGIAITSGYVYRGCVMPDLQGTYFFADYGSSNLWSFRYDGSTIIAFQPRTTELEPPGADTISLISSFGEDALGELYICDYADGEIYRIVPAIAPPDENNNGVADTCETLGDTNDDEIVDVIDLLEVLGEWGPCPRPCPPNCAADVNNDCTVDVLDLLMVLGNWS